MPILNYPENEFNRNRYNAEPSYFDDIPMGFIEAGGVHARNWEERDQADAETLRNRGFTSDFCGAWTALWAHIALAYGPELEAESARMRARKNLPGESCERILEKARSAYMAVIGAAVTADKFKSRLRRFPAAAFHLEATRRGVPYNLKSLLPEDKRNFKQNFGRYWRESWSYIALVQRVIGLPLVERESRTFKASEARHKPAFYIDRLSDLIGAVIVEKNKARGGSRLRRFEGGVAESLAAFRRECEHDCPNGKTADGKTCQRPHLISPPKDDTDPEADSSDDDESKGGSKRKKVLPFKTATDKLRDGVKIILDRAARGLLTAEEAEEAILLFAPVVALVAGTTQYPPKDGVPYADFGTEAAPDERTPDTEFVQRTFDEDCDFAEQNSIIEEAIADKFIRSDATPPAPDEVTLDDFLSAFFPDPYEEVNLRAFKPKGAPENEARFSALKWRTCREALACDPTLLAELHDANRTRGIYFVVNSGGDKAGDITRVNAFFTEMDAGTFAEQHAKHDAAPLASTVRVETLKSVHGYYLAAPGATLEHYDEVQLGLIHFYGSDPKIKDRSRVMWLPGFNHVSFNAGLLSYKPVTVAAFDPSRRFTAAEMLAAFPAAPEAKPQPQRPPKTLDELSGDFEAFKRELGSRISTHATARRNGRGNWDCRGICHNGKGATGLFYDPSQNFVWCTAGCGLATIARAFGLRVYEKACVGGAS